MSSHELVSETAEVCQLEGPLQVYFLNEEELGTEIGGFDISNTYDFNSPFASDALAITVRVATNSERDLGVTVSSINERNIDILLDELVNNGRGESLILCIPSEDGYRINAQTEVTKAKRFLDYLTNSIGNVSGHQPRLQVMSLRSGSIQTNSN